MENKIPECLGTKEFCKTNGICRTCFMLKNCETIINKKEVRKNGKNTTRN